MKFMHIIFLSISLLPFSTNGMAMYRSEYRSAQRTMTLSMHMQQQQQMEMARQRQERAMAMTLMLQRQQQFNQNYQLFLQSTAHYSRNHKTTDDNYQTYARASQIMREACPSPTTSSSSSMCAHRYHQRSMQTKSTQTDNTYFTSPSSNTAPSQSSRNQPHLERSSDYSLKYSWIKPVLCGFNSFVAVFAFYKYFQKKS